MAHSDKRNLSGKVAIVTGSSSGIGAGTAVELSKRGALLTITGRDAERLRKVAEECQKASPEKHQPLEVIAELSDEKGVEKIFQDTIGKYGRLDILVNNAAMAGDVGHVTQQSLEMFDQMVAVNLRAPFYLTQLAIPELEKTKGCIVNVSSGGSTIPMPLVSIYAMLKSALDHFGRCAAVDLGPKGIRVNTINPGYVPTSLGRSETVTKEIMEQFAKQLVNGSPLKMAGTTEGIALAIAFLASDEADFITGACLVADGGISLTSKAQFDLE